MIKNEDNKIHYPALDGLRGFAALAVLAFHTYLNVFWLGWIGVPFFFVLSGFLITGILTDSKKAHNYFTVFYARRSLRIFPIYFLTILLVLVFGFINRMAVQDVWLYFFYVQNFKLSFNNWIISFPFCANHTWSLAIEEQFYIFFPLLVYFLKERILIVVCFVLIVVAICTRYFLSIQFPGNPINWVNTFSNLDFLSAGALISIGLKQKKQAIINIVLFVLFCLTVCCVVLFKISFKNPINLTHINGQFFLVLLLFFAGIVIVNLVTKSNAISRIVFENKWITYTGKISYGLYLYHFPLYFVIDYFTNRYQIIFVENGFGVYILAAVKLMVTFFSAVLSYHLIESRLLKYKSHFKYTF